MTPERWREIESVLQDALDRSPAERCSFLEQACAGDEELKAEANSLIDAYLEASEFIEQPALAQDAHVLLDPGLDNNIGRDIGPYKIIERLGAGGMGEVYLAHDTRLNRQVALKLLPRYFAADDERLRRFQSEARAASALNHPNILTIYEVGETGGIYFIAAEFVAGQTIRELISEKKLSLEEILDIVQQIASALSSAHAAGIVHRDIKPENIMLRPDGLLKILDFGIAKLLEPEDRSNETNGLHVQTETGLILGTVNYMSPEQARGLPVDERTDIWSLGVVFYEMLTGRMPFSGVTRMDTLASILDREPASLSEASNEHYRPGSLLQSIVDKCLRKDATDRYRTVAELLVDLKELRKAPQPRLTQRILISPRVVWPIALVLLAATVATIFYLRPRRAANLSQSVSDPAKLYSQMSEREQLEFVSEQEFRISSMMSNRAVKLNDDGVRVIKTYVDRYVANLNQPEKGEAVRAVYQRAPRYIPLIAHSFAARRVPIIIGIYVPVIESGYRECYSSPLGARGLFQFMPQTAENYGVPRSEMCDVEKMTPAAAHFFADHMAELGEDSDSVTLVLLSYNRGIQWVRENLRQLRGTENYERSFWALLANRGTLNDESAGYVPSFFAAAIIGENPKVFGLPTPPLMSLAGVQ